ncbi:MAG: DUF1127 domain-containing protein [Pseudomonadota bacterium]
MLTSAHTTATRPTRFGIANVFKVLLDLDAAWRQRNHLSRLDASALNDIGLTGDDVRHEISRVSWDAPRSWMR